MKFHSKLPGIGTSVFTTITQLARQTGALNLGQGFPDFDPPREFGDAVHEHFRRGHNQYAPSAGVLRLRQAIAAQLLRDYGRKVDPEAEITVTDGATEALFDCAACCVHPGDEALLLDPSYDAYAPSVLLNGGRVTRIPLRSDFGIDYARLQDALAASPRLLFLNFPHNPSGAILGPEDLRQLAELLRPTDTLLVSDEVYEHIVFDGRRHTSVLENTELAERSFVVSSFGKTFHATGWKVGWVVAPKRLTEELRKVHQFVTFSTSTAVQHAFADVLTSSPQLIHQLASFYQAKRDLFRSALAESPLKLLPTPATYFQLVDYSALSQQTDTDFVRQLITQAGVAGIPLSPFTASNSVRKLVRFCFAKNDALLEEAAQRLSALVSEDFS